MPREPRALHVVGTLPGEADVQASALDLDTLFRRYSSYVAAIAHRLLGRDDDVDDTVQEVFLAAVRGLGSVRDPKAVKAWLARIAVRSARRRLRKRRLRSFFGLDDPIAYGKTSRTRRRAPSRKRSSGACTACSKACPSTSASPGRFASSKGNGSKTSRCSRGVPSRRPSVVSPPRRAPSRRHSPMADVAEQVARAREHVTPAWTPERERLLRAGVERRLESAKRRRRGVALAMAAILFCVLGALLWNRSLSRARLAASTIQREASARELLRLEDGSTATALTANARVEPIEIGARSVTSRLELGAARFSVTPNPDRIFRVFAHDVTVTVLGTIFSVSLEPGGVRVGVERGRVRVAWPAGEHELGVGEQLFVNDEAPPVAVALPADPSPPTEAPATPPSSAGDPTTRNANHATPGLSWRSLAEDGDYAKAFARMSAEGTNAVRDEPGDLLLAADVARLGGHPEKAVRDLERVVSAHSDDSRAPLAAFTLGRTLLDQLGRPREAAQAFATAHRLEPHGALAQDALAREVESWSRAGETSLAHDRADAYVKAYPKGRRLSKP